MNRDGLVLEYWTSLEVLRQFKGPEDGCVNIITASHPQIHSVVVQM